MKIQCLIVDDKSLAIDILANYIQKVSFMQLVGMTSNPLATFETLQVEPIDLVFLDIQMAELTNFQLIKIAGTKCKAILTTSYAEYVLDGFEHDVIDYLLKSILFECFYRAADKARIFFGNSANTADVVIWLVSVAPLPEHIFVKTDSRLQKVDIKDILYIEGLQNHIVIHTLADKIICLQPLKRNELQLPQTEFIRVHNSHIVSLRHFHAVERNRFG